MAHSLTRTGNIGIARVGELVIFVSRRQVSDDEFRESIEIGKSFPRPTWAALTMVLALPSAAQRKMVADNEAEQPHKARRVVSLCSSILIRGGLVSYGWLTNKEASALRAFAPENAVEALEWLSGGAVFDKREALRTFLDICRDLDVKVALRQPLAPVQNAR